MAPAVADVTKDFKDAQVRLTSVSREVQISTGPLSDLPADTCVDTSHTQGVLGTTAWKPS